MALTLIAPPVELPRGVLRVRLGPGANCSSAGSALDLLFYGSVLVGAVAVAFAAAFPTTDETDEAPPPSDPDADARSRSHRKTGRQEEL
jgi:hypothetical protein